MTATMTNGQGLADASQSAREPTTVPSQSRSAALSVAGGLLLSVGAVTALVPLLSHREVRVAEAPSLATTPPPDVGITDSSYLPGHSSGWHVHPGVHSVVILKGALTVYDDSCARTEYGPGQTYLGGAAPHVARNETTEVLDVAITYVYRPTSGGHGNAVSAPPGCDVR